MGERVRKCSGWGGYIDVSTMHVQVQYQDKNPTEQ
jgi:hypothetical protein